MFKVSSIALACVIITTACANNSGSTNNKTIADAAKENVTRLQEQVKNYEAQRLAAQEVDGPYIAGNSVPLAREATMPAILRETQVTTNFQREAVPLEKALRQLSEASGLLITATPDALLPASMFMPRTGSNRATAATGPVAVPLMPSSGPSLAVAAAMGMTSGGSGPLVMLRSGNSNAMWSVLDELARQAGIAWRPVPAGAEFYRLETRIFHLPAIPPTMGTTASLGRNGANGAAFETVNKTSFTLKDQDLVKGIANTVDALLTTGGNAVVSGESQSIIVTDTPEALARIARFMEDQHRTLSRRVRVVVDAYEITSRDNNDLGFNWDIVYATLNRSLTLQSPVTLAGTQVGNIGMASKSGSLAGSNLVVNALNEVASVVNQRSFPFTVTSGKPYTVAIRKTFNYVDQIQLPAQSTTGQLITTVTQQPSVMQKEETVGTFLTVIPTAKADGTIYVSLSIDQTSNRPLLPFTVGGSGATGVTVQQKTIDGTGFILESPTRSGIPTMMGGIEFDTGTATERRLAPGVPLLLGGSNQTETQKTRTVIVVTAVSEEGV